MWRKIYSDRSIDAMLWEHWTSLAMPVAKPIGKAVIDSHYFNASNGRNDTHYYLLTAL